MVTWNKTKIIATIGPASNNRKNLRAMLMAGVDIMRLNGAHGTIDGHKKAIRLIRQVSRKADFPLAILLDLPGPKLRIGTLKREKIYLKAGTKVTLHCGSNVQIKNEIPVTFKKLSKGLKAGTKIFLNDGIIELAVLKVKHPYITCKVLRGGEIRSHKGLNIPRAKLPIPSLTAKDKKLLGMAIREGVDYVALSFVRSANNIRALKRILHRRAPEIRVIAKIEKPEALDDLDDIIDASDAIMIARGDLGIEMKLYKVPTIQKDILLRCHLAGKPSITATQMLETMVNSKSQTRAETTDVANAVWEGSDAIMLSEETSIGKYPVTAVSTMTRIALEAEKSIPKYLSNLRQTIPTGEPAEAISRAAGLLAKDLNAKAIITPTETGRTALLVSKQRPRAQILAPTENEKVARRMCLYWGVRPLLMPHSKTVGRLLKFAEKLSLKSRFIKKGDKVVITRGVHSRKGDITRIVEVRRIGQR